MSGPIATAVIASPVGPIELVADEKLLRGLTIIPDAAISGDVQTHAILRETARQLTDYFAAKRRDFDLPLEPARSARGAALRDGIASIPYGDTMSYGALANMLDSGPRAVGQACRRNPYPIIIPCHRVTSAAGPEHYSGGRGVDTKLWLNRFEHQHKLQFEE